MAWQGDYALPCRKPDPLDADQLDGRSAAHAASWDPCRRWQRHRDHIAATSLSTLQPAERVAMYFRHRRVARQQSKQGSVVGDLPCPRLEVRLAVAATARPSRAASVPAGIPAAELAEQTCEIAVQDRPRHDAPGMEQHKVERDGSAERMAEDVTASRGSRSFHPRSGYAPHSTSAITLAMTVGAANLPSGESGAFVAPWPRWSWGVEVKAALVRKRPKRA